MNFKVKRDIDINILLWICFVCIGFQEFSVFIFNKVESYCEWGFQKAWEWDLKLLT
jgi:hypothetical protein